MPMLMVCRSHRSRIIFRTKDRTGFYVSTTRLLSDVGTKRPKKRIPPPRPSAITIDGSRKEGGGQILRQAICYAAILRREAKIENIRAGRAQPGLLASHLTELRLATEICGGTLHGDQLHSTEIKYRPPSSTEDFYRHKSSNTITGHMDPTASISLLLQVALPCALFGSSRPVHLILKGGTTNADTTTTMAPQYDYWERVFLPTLVDRCELDPNQIQTKVVRRGYSPDGGGEVHVHVQPMLHPLRPIKIRKWLPIDSIYIRSFHAGNVPRHMAEQMIQSALAHLKNETREVRFKTEIVTEPHNSVRDSGNGVVGIICVATLLSGYRFAGSAMGSPSSNNNFQARDVGIQAARQLVQTLSDGGCVDEWLQDQLILYMALADGFSEMLTGSLTLHTRTAMWVAKEMIGAKFRVIKFPMVEMPEEIRPPNYTDNGRVPCEHFIHCQGVGYYRDTTPK